LPEVDKASIKKLTTLFLDARDKQNRITEEHIIKNLTGEEADQVLQNLTHKEIDIKEYFESLMHGELAMRSRDHEHIFEIYFAEFSWMCTLIGPDAANQVYMARHRIFDTQWNNLNAMTPLQLLMKYKGVDLRVV
jgi:hypothetical protein